MSKNKDMGHPVDSTPVFNGPHSDHSDGTVVFTAVDIDAFSNIKIGYDDSGGWPTYFVGGGLMIDSHALWLVVANGTAQLVVSVASYFIYHTRLTALA